LYKINAYNFNQIRLDLTFLLYDVQGVTFFAHSVYTQIGYNPKASARRPDDLI